ncbi:MAG: imidazolonepropionase [Acidimicrobiia bacterium]|nr:imidazolonepropionase [Acidimicrobiia bacterium]
MTDLLITGIGHLTTNVGEAIRKAAVAIDGELITFAGSESDAPGVGSGRHLDADGSGVIPGFVDAHTHLVFAGDRADEFAARLGGVSYAEIAASGGGILSTVTATRMEPEETLFALAAARASRMLRAGTTTIEIKSGYGLSVTGEVRSLQVASRFTTETTFLGAHLVPGEFAGRADDYVDLVCGAMLEAAAPHAKWIDVFCERGAFDADQSARVLDAGRAAGLGLRLHGNQLGHGPGVQLAVEKECASVDHCTYLGDDDIEALASSDTVATFLPATDFSTRQPYPDARKVIDAGARVAIASNCNPGSSYTTSLPFCIAIAVRDMGMTIEEAIAAVTVGGAAALRRPDLGRLTPGSVGHAVVLDAPSYHHLAYRPGVQVVERVVT